MKFKKMIRAGSVTNGGKNRPVIFSKSIKDRIKNLPKEEQILLAREFETVLQWLQMHCAGAEVLGNKIFPGEANPLVFAMREFSPN